jgi:hypothetical protein
MIIKDSNDLVFPYKDGTSKPGSELTMEEKKKWLFQNQENYLSEKKIVETAIKSGMTEQIYLHYFNASETDAMSLFITAMATASVYELMSKMIETESLEEEFKS